jgi:hypothetical protein
MELLVSIIKYLSPEEDARSSRNRSPVLPMHLSDVIVDLEEESEEEEEEEVYDWNTEEEFIEFIKNKTGKQEPEKKDLYFEMVCTRENDSEDKQRGGACQIQKL